MTAQLIGPSKRFDALISLIRLFNGSDSLVRQVQSVAGRAAGLGEERNRVLHDSIFVHEDKTVSRFQVTAKRELKFGHVPMSPENLDELFNKIVALMKEFAGLQIRVMAELGPSLKTPPPVVNPILNHFENPNANLDVTPLYCNCVNPPPSPHTMRLDSAHDHAPQSPVG